jgi:hypothetical protein
MSSKCLDPEPARLDHDAGDEYVIVFRLPDQAEMQVIRSYLESFGIPAAVSADAFCGALDGIVLRVPEALAGQAVELIEQYKNGEHRLAEPNIPHVGENADGLSVFRVYSRPDRTVPVVVKDGFSWPALIFGPLWFLLNRMWVNSVLVFSLEIGAQLYLGSRDADTWKWIFYLLARFLIGKWGNTLLCLDLENKGYARLATVSAKNPAYARAAALVPPDDSA